MNEAAGEADPPAHPHARALVRRGLALTALTFGIVGGVFLSFTIAHSRSVDSEVVPFGGWQVTFADAALALTCLAAFAPAITGLRRLRVPAGTSVSRQVVATVVALALGTGVAALGDLGGKHVLTWASNHTSAARHAAEETRRALGDATHRPMPPRAPGMTAAPAALAKPLLTPADLGPGWQYGFNPAVTILHPGKPVDAPAPIYALHTILVTMHWNGTSWFYDQNVFEGTTRYSSHADALEAFRLLIRQSAQCPGCEPSRRPTRIAGERVWRTYPNPEIDVDAALVRGSQVIRLLVGPPHDTAAGVRQASAILRAAVQRFASR